MISTDATVTGWVSYLILRTYLLILPQGDGVPTHVDPSSIQKEGKKVLNTCQNIPRTSEEWNKDSDLFQRVQEAAEPIFMWIREKVHDFFTLFRQSLTNAFT